MRATFSSLGLAVVLGLAGCVGLLGDRVGEDSTSGEDGDGEVPTEEVLAEIGTAGMRLLSAAEYDLTIADLTGVTDAQSALLLPENRRTPYDNDYTLQEPSEALISGAELLAGDLASRISSDAELVSGILPCQPSGPSDAACFEDFLRTFGRRALRRPLTEAEVDAYGVLLDHAIDAGDFGVAVDSALRLFLQHPELLYRVEIGEPVEDEPGVFRLSQNEIATRLSYLAWGSTPPDWLLDAADSGTLEGDDGIRAAAVELLDDDRARARIARFHSLWLGYEQLPHSPALAQAMQVESRALVERVIFDDRAAWNDLLRAEQTFVDDALAELYGLPAPGSPAWVDYPALGGARQRRGLLSQGAFLSAFSKFDDTSPTQRGILIRTRLFCQVIAPPPPGVNVDEPPQTEDPNACKQERYAQHGAGGCAGCHDLLDPVGFGLENYDQMGRFRETDTGRPECSIEGRGELVGIGEFSGPAELSDLMIESGVLDACVATQLYRFAIGRYELGEEDRNFVERLAERGSGGGELHFDELLLDMVSAPAFRFRREPEAEPEAQPEAQPEAE